MAEAPFPIKAPVLSPSARKILDNVRASIDYNDIRALELDLRDTACYLIAKSNRARVEFINLKLDKACQDVFVDTPMLKKLYQGLFGACGRRILLENTCSRLTIRISRTKKTIYSQAGSTHSDHSGDFYFKKYPSQKPMFSIWVNSADNNSLWLIPEANGIVRVDDKVVCLVKDKPPELNGVRLENGSIISFHSKFESVVLSVLVPQEEENYLYHESERLLEKGIAPVGLEASAEQASTAVKGAETKDALNGTMHLSDYDNWDGTWEVTPYSRAFREPTTLNESEFFVAGPPDYAPVKLRSKNRNLSYENSIEPFHLSTISHAVSSIESDMREMYVNRHRADIDDHDWFMGLEDRDLKRKGHDDPIKPVYLHSIFTPESAIEWEGTAEQTVAGSGHGTASASTINKPPKSQMHMGNVFQMTEEENNTTESIELGGPATKPTTAGLADSRAEGYSTLLAEDLIAKLDVDWVNEQTLEEVASLLPDLLETLAIKVGYEAPSLKHGDAMVFLHKHRENIGKCFRQALNVQDSSIPVSAMKPISPEVMDRWQNEPIQDKLDIPEEMIPQSSQAILDTFDATRNFPQQLYIVKEGNFVSEYENEVEVNSPIKMDTTDAKRKLESQDFEEYRLLIQNDPGFEWLLKSIRREFYLVRQTPDRLGELHKQIVQALPKQTRISRTTSPRRCTVVYHTNWNPRMFLESQSYDEPHHLALAQAITLTGNAKDAQALSCKEYVALVWPSSGPQLLSLIQDALASEKPEPIHTCELPNGTIICVSSRFGYIDVKASGIPDFVAEIGEQLAWLGAALRIPYTSIIDNFACSQIEVHIHQSELIRRDSISCSFSYLLDPRLDSFWTANGQCWHALFRPAVVVEGFPIRRRPESDISGLEIPLDMMAALIGSRAVEIFQSKVFIKGFSAMLVPTRKVENMVAWHLLHTSRPDKRIAYLDCPVWHEPLQRLELPKARHIVGWCSEAACYIGAKSANYKIRKSGLPRASAGCALEKVEIQGGQFITGTAGFSIGNREKPVHISRDGYMNKMQWMSTKYVLLWDEEAKIGWLVNGARALLHVLRASLQYSKEKIKSSFLMDAQDLIDISLEAGSDAALKILLDRGIREKPLSIEKDDVSYEEVTVEGTDAPTVQRVEKRSTKYYCIQDRVEHIYSVMEKLVDHQVDIERQSGLSLSVRPRRTLEGWDFRDLFTDGDPFFPRVATLQTIGKGWVDFTRALNAVCLLGRGFGELIQPRLSPVAILTATTPLAGTAAAFVCNRWSRVPTDRYYLAVCIADMQEIIDNEGDPDRNPVRVCDKIIWQVKANTFLPCPCTGHTAHPHHIQDRHHDPVQALFPGTFTKALSPVATKEHVHLVEKGAVLFGHSKSLDWFWRDHGDPVPGPLPRQSSTLAVPVLAEAGSSGKASTERSTSIASISSLSGADTSQTTVSFTSASTKLPLQPIERSQLAESGASGHKTGKGKEKGKEKGEETGKGKEIGHRSLLERFFRMKKNRAKI